MVANPYEFDANPSSASNVQIVAQNIFKNGKNTICPIVKYELLEANQNPYVEKWPTIDQ